MESNPSPAGDQVPPVTTRRLCPEVESALRAWSSQLKPTRNGEDAASPAQSSPAVGDS